MLGRGLAALGRPQEAIEEYDRAIALRPLPQWRLEAGSVVPVIADSVEQILWWRRRCERCLDQLLAEDLGPADPRLLAVNNLGFYLGYHGMNDRPIAEKAAAVQLKLRPDLAWTAPGLEKRRPARDKGDPIRVGVASSNLAGDHTIGLLFRGLIRRLPRDRFHVTAIDLSGNPEFAKEVGPLADAWIQAGKRLEKARERIAALGLDVLVFADIGMEGASYFLAFARMAPVQMALYGHPVTTGLRSLDYFVSWGRAEPADAQDHYTERLIAPTDLPAWYEPLLPSGQAASRSELGLPEGRRLYGCAQSAFKIHPDMDRLFAGILDRDREGVIVLVKGMDPHWDALLRQRLARSVGDRLERIVWIDRMGIERFMAFNASCDVMLDTVHFCGLRTSLDALAVGTPIVTWPGAMMRGRQTFGLYESMGLGECVAHCAEEYVEKAFGMATDGERRAAARNRILARHDCIYRNEKGVMSLATSIETGWTGLPVKLA